ncbi:MAG: PIN domain-containing protein [Opitutae bacterium]|nr:PIN domain-containing protein [Opitutae bacterium]MBC9889530.1 PIN domain-containing protein [Opitutae bacterium]
MSEPLFFDTNIVFYAFDSSEHEKQPIAQDLIANAIATGSGWISVQVLGEFFHVTVVRKQLMTSEEAEKVILSLYALNIVDLDRALVRTAISMHRKFQTSYWDSLILASANRCKCGKLISEDFTHNRDYNGVTVTNPFLRA